MPKRTKPSVESAIINAELERLKILDGPMVEKGMLELSVVAVEKEFVVKSVVVVKVVPPAGVEIKLVVDFSVFPVVPGLLAVVVTLGSMQSLP